MLSLQRCLTLCNSMDYTPLGSSVHGILQERILECVVMASPRDLPDPGIEPVSFMSPILAGGFFITETPKKSQYISKVTGIKGLLWWLSGKECRRNCRRRGFHPWVRKIPWRRKWQSTRVFLPGKSLGGTWQATVHWAAESDITQHTHTASHRMLMPIFYLDSYKLESSRR